MLTAKLVDYVCVAAEERACPGGFVGTFLTFEDPQFRGAAEATVTVHERGLNPAACGKGGIESMGGFMDIVHQLRKAAAGWRVVRRTMGAAGTTVC